jgi:uncharacterized protein (DUF305 family)
MRPRFWKYPLLLAWLGATGGAACAGNDDIGRAPSAAQSDEPGGASAAAEDGAPLGSGYATPPPPLQNRGVPPRCVHRPEKKVGEGTFDAREVASVVLLLHGAAIDVSDLAVRRASAPGVKEYAARVAAEHRLALEDMGALLQRLGGSADDVTAATLARLDKTHTRELETTEAATFDLTFMTMQIASHARALALIDYSLLPSLERRAAGIASGPDITARSTTELRNELHAARERIAADLDLALRLQKTLRT